MTKFLLVSLAVLLLLSVSTFAIADSADIKKEDITGDKPVTHVAEISGQTKERRVVVITDAEFVPFSAYLGLPNVNELPPTSSGSGSGSAPNLVQNPDTKQ